MQDDHLLTSYQYHLPPEQIAQHPAEERDRSRLMVLESGTGPPGHLRFHQVLSLLQPGDLLITNSSKVFPARLLGRKASGGRVELLLLHYPTPVAGSAAGWHEARAQALMKSSKRPRAGTMIEIGPGLTARVDAVQEGGKVDIALIHRQGEMDRLLEQHGQIPLPPYISRPEGSSAEDRERYQTRYARETGSVAAPTAGLHFSDRLLAAIDRHGIQRTSITLHVGYGTFAPVRHDDIRCHAIHSEQVEIPPDAAARINRVKQAGGRIWAVGTTTVRALEFAAGESGRVRSVQGPCDLFIYPGYEFKVVDNLITNFHLPGSSLLFLVAAMIGRERIIAAYREAVRQGYRFFSYGDAMAVVTRPRGEPAGMGHQVHRPG